LRLFLFDAFAAAKLNLMTAAKPISTLNLFPILEGKLIELLKTLNHDDWSRPTLAKQWTVKDVAAHLLDGNLKRLAMQRDGFFGLAAPPLDSYGSFLQFINRNNAEWVQAARRMSPRILIDLLESTSKQVYELFSALDPLAPALWAVTWAGEDQSPNWFDIAREYTERWHHQQQVRMAVNRPGISGHQLYFPVLDTFMRGLPHAFRAVEARQGTIVRIDITGEAGGSWFLQRLDSAWQLTEPTPTSEATLSMDQELAWRVFTKAVDQEAAAKDAVVSGDAPLALKALSLVAVLA
jgi:uncharacterized protein (TIGR03083 family)